MLGLGALPNPNIFYISNRHCLATHKNRAGAALRHDLIRFDFASTPTIDIKPNLRRPSEEGRPFLGCEGIFRLTY